MSHELILLIEDEAAIADVVEYVLKEHGFRSRTARDGHEGYAAFRKHAPDMVLLDLNLPGIPGLDLFRRMRQERANLPVIMLTSRTDEVDRVTGLELGADDYVTKPFSPRELVARVRAVLRRHTVGAQDAKPHLRAGPLTLVPADWNATCGGMPVALSRQEFRLLEALMRHPARVFARDLLIDIIYDGETCVTDRSIDAQVKRIRQRIAEVRPGFDPIQTVYGLGYKFNGTLSSGDEDSP
jgi:two-component system response regulator BaeR